MTHTSSFRYGYYPRRDASSIGECGEIRVGYIDPVTGEAVYGKRNARKGVKKEKRPVLVDGVRFDSVTAASKEVGCTSQALGLALRKGSDTCRGHRIQLAEESR